MKFMPFLLACALFAAACTPTPPPTATPSLATTVPETADTPEASVSDTSPAATSSSAGAHRDFIWSGNIWGGTQAWQFEDGEAQLIDLPMPVSYAYGYSPATGRLLYSTPTEPKGAGPSQMAVNNLWLLDVASGQATPIFEEEVVVEADLAPDGERIAYILATDTTYELRWRNLLNGEDTLLASDVAFTFSISPQGDKVAFTRESNYGLPGEPGLYVVDVATGEEIKVADADRAGAGSIDDRPAWSPSGTRILLPTYGTTAAAGLVLAAADGSGAVTLAFDPATSAEEWYEAPLANPHWVTDSAFLASAAPGGTNLQLGGELSIYLFQLNETADTIIAGEQISPGTYVGWDVPGESIWVQMDSEMHSVPLPAR